MFRKLGHCLLWFIKRATYYGGILIFTVSYLLLAVSTIASVLLTIYIHQWHRGLDEILIDRFIDFEPPTLTEILYEDGTPLIELPAIENWQERIPEYRRKMTFGDIPPIMVQAFLAAEDQRFFEHHGIDYRGISRAAIEVAKATITASYRCLCIKIVLAEGGSTLTQQEVRQLFLTEQWKKEQHGKVSRLEKITRKIQEARMSIWLEKKLTKRFGNQELAKVKIFEVFSMITYYGEGHYGLAAAAEYYLGKKLEELNSPADAALLAGIVKDPIRYSPRRNPSLAKIRRDGILAKMRELFFLSEEELSIATSTQIVLAKPQVKKTEAPAVVEYVLESLWKTPKISNPTWKNGITIKTTVRRSYQLAANNSLEYALTLYRRRHPEYAEKIQGAMVVLQNGTGKILALVGGSPLSTNYTSFNRATARRQPGSSFKPFVYLSALEHGWRPDQTKPGYGPYLAIDAPVSVKMGRNKPRHRINNYDGRFHGKVPLARALAESLNGATAWLGQNIISGNSKESITAVVETANRLGLIQNIEKFPTTAIGAEEVTPLGLTAAYKVFAAKGIFHEPLIIEEVIDISGKVTITETEGKLVIEPYLADQMAEMLRHTVVWIHGTGKALQKLPFPVFGKTGTTNDFKDAWFCGSTYGDNGITACIWIGFDHPAPLGDSERCKPLHPRDREYCEPGGRVALPGWWAFAGQIYNELDGEIPPSFPEELEKNVHEVEKNWSKRK